MPVCAFTEKTKKPNDQTLAQTLGTSAKVWSEFHQYLLENFAPVTEAWKFMKSGWVLLLKRKTRTICYLFPAEGSFTVAFVLGERAVAVARQSKLPQRILDAIEEARPYAEGRGFYVKAAKASDLVHLQRLTEIKLTN